MAAIAERKRLAEIREAEERAELVELECQEVEEQRQREEEEWKRHEEEERKQREEEERKRVEEENNWVAAKVEWLVVEETQRWREAELLEESQTQRDLVGSGEDDDTVLEPRVGPSNRAEVVMYTGGMNECWNCRSRKQVCEWVR